MQYSVTLFLLFQIEHLHLHIIAVHCLRDVLDWCQLITNFLPYLSCYMYIRIICVALNFLLYIILITVCYFFIFILFFNFVYFIKQKKRNV